MKKRLPEIAATATCGKSSFSEQTRSRDLLGSFMGGGYLLLAREEATPPYFYKL